MSGFTRSSSYRPCPICNRKKSCSIAPDGLHFCIGNRDGYVEPAGFFHVGVSSDGTWGLWRAEGDQDRPTRRDYQPTATKPVHVETKPENNRAFLARVNRRQPMSWQEREAFYHEHLGLTGWTGRMDWRIMEHTPDYHNPEGRIGWTIPEFRVVQGELKVVAMHERYDDGFKRSDGNKEIPSGCRRGAFVPEGWHQQAGPILCPEGASCTTTLDLMGLATIGRFNCGHGTNETIAYLVNRHAPGRDVVIMGENDQHDDGTWPGRDKGREAARKLADLLGRRVGFALPTGKHKDTRDWFRCRVLELRALNEFDEESLSSEIALGQELLAHIGRSVEWFEPGKILSDRQAADLGSLGCRGSDGASLKPVTEPTPADRERIERNRRFLAEQIRKDAEPLAGYGSTAQQAAMERWRARADLVTYPCHGPRMVATVDPPTDNLVLRKHRCEQCESCRLFAAYHAEIHIGHLLGDVEHSGGRLFEAVVSGKWESWTKRFERKAGDNDGYLAFKMDDGRMHVFTTVEELGSPVKANDLRCEIREYLAAAVKLQDGSRFYLTSTNWAQERLGKPDPKGYKFFWAGHIEDQVCDEIAEAAGAEVHVIGVTDTEKRDHGTISKRLWTFPGGCRSEQLDYIRFCLPLGEAVAPDVFEELQKTGLPRCSAFATPVIPQHAATICISP